MNVRGSVVLCATEPDAAGDWHDLLRRFLLVPRDYSIFVLTYPGSPLTELAAHAG